MTKNRTAFTLIELLIVVAIIAILAAIAVPNFLEAQTRAKVARVYADFRETATALEAYMVDSNVYIPSTQGNGYIEPYVRRMKKLTTPVPYITSVPGPSPFEPPRTNITITNTNYEYYDKTGVEAINDTVVQNGWFMLCAGLVPRQSTTPVFKDGPKWLLMDRGPDAIWPWQWPGQTWDQVIVFYDPTNGTVSEGDIYRSQLKSSFN